MKAVIFDLTQTLQIFDFNIMLKDFRVIFKKLGKDISIDIIFPIYKKHYDEYQCGKTKTDMQFAKGFLKNFGLSGKENEFLELHKDVRKNFISLPKNLEKVLENLKKKYKLGILSNGVSKWARNDWNVLNFNTKKYFNQEIYSSDIGLTKPDKKAFMYILKKMGIKPKDAWYIGDDFVNDIEGSKKAGLKTIYIKHYNAKGTVYQSKQKEIRADYSVNSLKDILKIL